MAASRTSQSRRHPGTRLLATEIDRRTSPTEAPRVERGLPWVRTYERPTLTAVGSFKKTSLASQGSTADSHCPLAAHPPPSLLLLDEPTSHLDALNEAAFGDALAQVSTECALLVIAHRFSTFRRANQIVLLDGGETVAVGTHDELLDSSDYYRVLTRAPMNVVHQG